MSVFLLHLPSQVGTKLCLGWYRETQFSIREVFHSTEWRFVGRTTIALFCAWCKGCFNNLAIYTTVAMVGLLVVKSFTRRGPSWTLLGAFVASDTQANELITPFRTAVPFRGQSSQSPSSLSPKRNCSPKILPATPVRLRRVIRDAWKE